MFGQIKQNILPTKMFTQTSSNTHMGAKSSKKNLPTKFCSTIKGFRWPNVREN